MRNLAKHQDTIGSTTDQALLRANNLNPITAKSNEELSEAPVRPTKQAPAAGHSLPAIPVPIDSPTAKPARRLPPDTMRSRNVAQGLRERKLGMGGDHLVPGEMRF